VQTNIKRKMKEDTKKNQRTKSNMIKLKC